MNPGDLSWKLAHRAARNLIARATSIRPLHDILVRVRAERLLANSWLPAASLIVASNGSRTSAPVFDVVDKDAPAAVQDLYTAWANEVVDLARRTLIL